MNHTDMQRKSFCPLCNNWQLAELPKSVSPVLNLLCEECGLIFQPAIDADERNKYYHSSSYHTHSANRSARRLFISRGLLLSNALHGIRNLQNQFSFIKPNCRLLDIGCGYGPLLSACRDLYNCEVTGIEPSHQACQIAKEWYGLDLLEATLEEADITEPFDRIMAVHAIEHTDDPVSFLKRCGELLVEDGILYIECPNLLHPTAGFSWPRFFESDHLYQFTKVTLSVAAGLAGFSVKTIDDQKHVRAILVKDGKETVVVPEDMKRNAEKVKQFIQDYPTIRRRKLYPVRRLFFLIWYAGRVAWHKAKDATVPSRQLKTYSSQTSA